MEKINIAELLKDCPLGMELDCTIFNNVTFGGIDSGSSYPIEIKIGDKNTVTESLTEFGEWNTNENSKCVIFPKGKTTWKGFVPPCKFKDGDIVASSNGDYIFMLKKANSYPDDDVYKVYNGTCYFGLASAKFLLTKEDKWYFNRLATEEEKQKLFQAVKDNGYRWNNETKSLERVIGPKFKLWDIIRHVKTGKLRTITKIHQDCYECDDRYALVFENQDNWELAPNKFDINTLVPFESRVLVRDFSYDVWKVSFWGCLINNGGDFIYDTTRGLYKQCIPYEGNENLLGNANECDEFYKTWE